MKKENGILEELKNMDSPLAGLPRSMPYSVPDGYFAQFASALPDTIKNINEPEIVPAWGKAVPFGIPKGYFDNLTSDIVAIATAGDFASELSKESPFTVPHGYFEQLPAQILKAAKETDVVAKPAKIIQLKRHNVFRSVQLAAAAIFILFIGVGSYITFFSDGAYNPEKILASVPGNEIQDYLQHTYRIDVDRVVGDNEINNLKLDNKEIIQYLDETGWDIVE